MFKRLFVVLLILFCAGVSHAWDFKLSADHEIKYFYLSRVGPGDLFGNAQQAQASADPGLTTIGLSGPVFGQVVPEGLSSKGSDGSWTQQKLWLYPVFNVSPALALHSIISFQGDLNGNYTGGPNWIATPTPYRAGWFVSSSRSNTIRDAVAVAALRALWIKAEMPIGTLYAGRRPFIFGTGWGGFHGRDTAVDSIALDVPWGPFVFGAGVVMSDTGEANSPYDTRNLDRTPLTLASSTDRNELQAWNWIFSVIYRNAAIDIGYMNRTIFYNRQHGVPFTASTLRDDVTGSFARIFVQAMRTIGGTTADTTVPVYGDITLSTNVGYFKYSNGRFFLNGELDVQYLRATRDGGRPISGRPWAGFIEGGAFSGPVKLALMYVYSSGHDRQGGVLDVSNSGTTTGGTQVGDTWSQYILLGGRSTPLEAYGWLLGFYGGGNNAYDATGNPSYLDFKAFGARADYAIASNLNFFVSYLYAQRASNTGSWWGQYTGGIGPASVRGSNVPNNNLGWEFGVGTDWKLLEGMALENKFAVWQPGEWFKHAYVDWSSATTIPDPALTEGEKRINPGRSINPIIGTTMSIRVNF